MGINAKQRRFVGITALVAVGAITLASCSLGGEPDGKGTTDVTASAGDVTLITHDSFTLSEGVLDQFTAETGIRVKLVSPGDAGTLVNQLILTKDSPLGDAVYGIDTTYASRAVDEGVLAEYVSPAAPAGFEDFDGRLTAVDQGDVCLNVDHVWFTEHGLAEPTTLEDLTQPDYRGLTVVSNPSTSSPGLAFLLATVGHFGEDGWQQYWKDLLDNGLKVAEGWSDAYYVDFSGSEGHGPRPIVLSYSSSPAAEVMSDGTSRTGNVEASCFRQVEYIGVIAGAQNPEGAQRLVDFMLSDVVQEDIPDSMYMYPVSPTVQIPAEWVEHAALAENPIELDPARITEGRATWLKEWLALVG